jgi:hypothetical protein
MLAHSPPLPLVVEYYWGRPYRGRHCNIPEDEERAIAEDEEGAILALKQRDRVRCVRLRMAVTCSFTSLQKLVMAMDEEYPILEYLIIALPIGDNRATLIFPETFQAPHLRHLSLEGFALPIGSRLLTNAAGIVTLNLAMICPLTYFHPNTLLQWISLMPQLERLAISFLFAAPNRDVERQLTHAPIMTPFILPNLHWFSFGGVSTYLEAIVHRISAPRLEKLEIVFFNQRIFSIPCLLQFMNTTENLRFDKAEFVFFVDRVIVSAYPRGAEMLALSIRVFCCHLWQVSSIAQISNTLTQMFSTVEHLTLRHEEHSWSSEEHNEVDRTEWRKFFRSFSNVKALHIEKGLVRKLSRCLELEDGELPLELLPELQELTYFGNSATRDAFTSFINAHQNAGRPVTLNRRSPSPDPSFFVPPVEILSISPAGNEAGNDFDT